MAKQQAYHAAWRWLGAGLLAAAGCANGGPVNVGPDDDGGADAVAPIDAALDTKHPHDATDPTDTGVDAGPDAPDDDVQPFVEGGPEASSGDGPVDAPIVDVFSDAPVILPSPIGKWNFDEGSGTSSADLSGNGHAATLVGGASWTTAGKEGAGLALDGVTGYADVGVTLVTTTSSFTVMTWASFAVVGPWQVALSEDDVTGSLFGLKARGDGSNEFDFDAELSDVTSPGFIVAQSTTVAQAKTWVHLAGVHDASGSGAMKLYVNGALQANAAVGQSLLAATGHFVIGRGLYNGATGSFLNGTVDEVAVYGAALTDAQVASIYDSEM